MSDPRLWTPDDHHEFLERFDSDADKVEAALNIWQTVSDAEEGNMDQVLGGREGEG